MKTQFKVGDIVTLAGYDGAFELKEGVGIVYPLCFEIRGNRHSFTKEGKEDLDQAYPVLKLVREPEDSLETKPYAPSRRDYFAAAMCRDSKLSIEDIVYATDNLIKELDRSEK